MISNKEIFAIIIIIALISSNIKFLTSWLIAGAVAFRPPTRLGLPATYNSIDLKGSGKGGATPLGLPMRDNSSDISSGKGKAATPLGLPAADNLSYVSTGKGKQAATPLGLPAANDSNYSGKFVNATTSRTVNVTNATTAATPDNVPPTRPSTPLGVPHPSTGNSTCDLSSLFSVC